MQTRYPAAVWRPLGRQSEPVIGRPRVLIFHTMVGYLSGTYSMFHRGGYDGTEAHFGVGMDGRVEQWQDIDRQADANWDANAYSTSIETEDKGHPSTPWSAKQVEALAELGAWWCKTTGNPAELVSSTSGHGIGYHRQFAAWNRSHHSCPGAVREGQLRDAVIPLIRVKLGQLPKHLGRTGASVPSTPTPTLSATEAIVRDLPTLRKGDSGEDVETLQHLILARSGELPRYGVDGDFGDETEDAVKAFQSRADITVDGIVGTGETWPHLLRVHNR